MGWNWKRSVDRTRHVFSLGFLGSASWIPWKLAAPRPLPCRKKALLIGINYRHHLAGPQKDVGRMKRILVDKYHYKDQDIVVLTDEPDVPEKRQPTHDNIMRELGDFLADQRPGDHHFFMFAGHADQEKTNNVEEEDGMDERILPLDALLEDGTVDDTKVIKDDVLKDCLVDPLLPDNRLIAVFDSCHSGTLLDLPHHRCNRVNSQLSRVRRTVRRVREIYCTVCAVHPSRTRRRSDSTQQVQQVPSRPGHTRKCSGYCPRYETSNQYVLCISACKDSQTVFENNAGVSMSMIIMELLEHDPTPTLKKFMRSTSDRLYTLGKEIEDGDIKYERELAEWGRKTGYRTPPSTPDSASSSQSRPKLGYFVQPQISSRHPLRMGAILSP